MRVHGARVAHRIAGGQRRGAGAPAELQRRAQHGHLPPAVPAERRGDHRGQAIEAAGLGDGRRRRADLDAEEHGQEFLVAERGGPVGENAGVRRR
jgi:hypothetical protein